MRILKIESGRTHIIPTLLVLRLSVPELDEFRPSHQHSRDMNQYP